MEQALDLNFNLANRWGCILLLDEADVFLASRTETDFERNGLVAGSFPAVSSTHAIEFPCGSLLTTYFAVFLRVLEYYAGILFLTTNRVGVIDEAFRSRIHVSLYYPPLGRDETKAVFELNLRLIKARFENDRRTIQVDAEEIISSALSYFDNNAKARWNGRQIRNACQTALALAEFKAQGGSHQTILDPDAEVRLAVENFMIVSDAYLEFTKYLKQLYGLHEDVRARELGHRARETARSPLRSDVQLPGAGTVTPQPGAAQGQAQLFSNVVANPTPAFQSQLYQQPMVTIPGPPQQSYNAPHPTQQLAAFYANQAQAAQVPSPGHFVGYGNPNQLVSSPVTQPNQSFVGMQFDPLQADLNQGTQPWQGQPVLPNTGMGAHPFSQQAQQAYQAQMQPATNPGAQQSPNSAFHTQQSMTPMQMQQLQQQQQQQ